jgi:3-hydroxyacyl-[acyl-carrier-protein] dehydratase
MALAIDPTLPQADITSIKRMIPHRYPFLMIDRVVNIALNRSAVGIKNVTVNEPHFQGHFPVLPVMPGVLIVEAMAQTSAVLVVETLDLIDKDLLVYFMSIDTAKFRHVVSPGETLELHVSVMRGRGKIWKFRGEGRVGDTLCAEAEFTAMILTQAEASAKG